MRRWLRVLICLLLICCILVNLSPLRADATAAGLAGTIASVTAVNVPAGLVYGAAAITLGVMAGTNDDFQNLVASAVSAGSEWIVDGCVELLRVVDEAGTAAYYVLGEFLEELRSSLFSAGILTNDVSVYPCEVTLYDSDGEVDTIGQFSYPARIIGFKTESGGSSIGFLTYGYDSFTVIKDGKTYSYYATKLVDLGNGVYWKSIYGSTDDLSKYYTGVEWLSATSLDSISDDELHPITSSYDLSLGQISTVPIDGTSALDWAPDYAANRLKVIEGGNDPDPDSEPPNDGKWFWPIMLPLTAASLYTMSQADEWSGQTPQEFDDYSTNTEFEILDRPEIDGYQGIELSPVTNPDVNPDTGEGADPTEPGEPTEPSEDESTGSDSETNWFEKIWKSIVELPNSFKTWFEDLKKGIEELPSKFSQWASDTILAIQNLPQAFANLFADVVAAIQSVPQTIKDFFTPKSPDNHDKFALADLSKFFPFCIPFDLYDFFTLLNADPVAPVLSWEIKDLAGQTYSLDVDLSQWDSVALLFRRLQLFLFITGLAAASRKFIKW